MFDLLAQNATAIIGILGALAFMVVVMVELTKELPLVKKVPTKLWTIIVSMLVCIAAVVIYFAFTAAPLYRYYIALAFFGAFIVAYIAMYGWENTKDLYDRFKKKD